MGEFSRPEIGEKCAVAAASTSNSEFNSVELVYGALLALQHRGDAASGISAMTFNGRFDGHSDEGFVRDVFKDPEKMARISGPDAVGHNLWSTHSDEPHAQPIWINPTKFALGHNGQLSDYSELQLSLEKRRIDTTHLNDSEMLAYEIEQYIRNGLDLPDAVRAVYPKLKGGFSCVAMQGDVVVGFRDQFGLRPLEIQKTHDGHLIASETCAFRPDEGEYIGQVAPGEMVVMQKGSLERFQLVEPIPKFDIFEDIYLANRLSQRNGETIDAIRRRLGQELAEQYPFIDKDYLVVPVPDTSVPIAEAYAKALGLEYFSAIDRDRYYPGRSFMQKNRESQHHTVRYKLNVIPGSIRARHIIVIEDSIMRMTSLLEVNEKLIAEEPASITYLSASAPVGYADHAGVNTRKQEHLVASYLTPEQIRQKVNSWRLGYLAISRMIRAMGRPASTFNLASFTGEYPYELGDHRKNIKESVSLQYLENAYAEA